MHAMHSLTGWLAGSSTLLSLLLAAAVIVQHRHARSLAKLACTEPQTGLANRREFTRVLRAEISRTSRTGRPFGIVLIDVDELKLLNDRCGHRAGDRAILRVANVIRVASRKTDTPARIGGDEFAVLLPESDEQTALRFVGRARALLASHRRGGAVTVGAGVARHPRDGATADELLAAADRELYVEKWSRPRSTPGQVRRPVPGAPREFV